MSDCQHGTIYRRGLNKACMWLCSTCGAFLGTEREPFTALREEYAAHGLTQAAHAEATAQRDALAKALRECETVLTMVEPRSHKAEYLAALESARAALAALAEK